MNWTYLGDAVYAKYDGYHIKLVVGSHTNPDAVIYLDDQVAESLVAFIKQNMAKPTETITDDYQTWSKTCPMCGQDTMQVVRPGKVQCSNCG